MHTDPVRHEYESVFIRAHPWLKLLGSVGESSGCAIDKITLLTHHSPRDSLRFLFRPLLLLGVFYPEERLRLPRILTFDSRSFRPQPPPSGGFFIYPSLP